MFLQKPQPYHHAVISRTFSTVLTRVLLCAEFLPAVCSPRPHIVFMLADDMASTWFAIYISCSSSCSRNKSTHSWAVHLPSKHKKEYRASAGQALNTGHQRFSCILPRFFCFYMCCPRMYRFQIARFSTLQQTYLGGKVAIEYEYV